MSDLTEMTETDAPAMGVLQNQEVIIISTERSGTNFFCECLGEFAEAARFFEFFARDGVYGLASNPILHDRLSEALGYEVGQDDRNERLVTAIREEPIKHLKIFSRISRQAGKKFLSLKIFPGQIEPGKLRLGLTGPNKRVIFITRSRLDCYISFEKALMSDVWQNADTSDVRPEIDYGNFIRWAMIQDEWYGKTERKLREAGTPYQIYSYETDINCPKDALVERQYFTLRSFGLDVQLPVSVRPAIFTKQDTASDPFAKIKNGDALRAELEANDALEFAMSKPLLG